MSLDGSIQPLIIALNRVGIRTTVSCSGLLEDHKDNDWSMGTPYLCINLNHSNKIKSKQMQYIFLGSGFKVKNKTTRHEHRLKFYERYNMEPSKNHFWEIEKDASECYYFDFGLGDFDFENPEKHDIEFEMLDYPEWQAKIKRAWIEAYRRALRMWF